MTRAVEPAVALPETIGGLFEMIAISTPLTAAAGAPPAALPIPRLPVCPVCRGAFDANCANCDGTGIDPAAREGHEAWRTDLEQRLGKRRKFS